MPNEQTDGGAPDRPIWIVLDEMDVGSSNYSTGSITRTARDDRRALRARGRRGDPGARGGRLAAPATPVMTTHQHHGAGGRGAGSYYNRIWNKDE